MCTAPLEKDGNVFACRICDECVATRRAGWVSRAMAEKATHPFTFVLTLTYGSATQEQRDAATMFCYADIRAFLARLRSAMRRDQDRPGGYVRFIVAGEQGDRNGRCHWHMILFTNRDLCTYGTFVRKRLVNGQRVDDVLTDRADMISVGKQKKRLNWSLWNNGFVLFQEPDLGGIQYVLSYCLKDQMTIEAARGTARETRLENFATGLFRMSKRPAIGNDWLIQKLESLWQRRAVPPTLELQIPGMSGFWYPSGSFRERLLWSLVALNQRIVWDTGAVAPQWPNLLLTSKDNPKDLEVLQYGDPEQIEQGHEDDDTFADVIRAARLDAAERAAAFTRRKCGASTPCESCLNYLNDKELAAIQIERYLDSEDFTRYRAVHGSEPLPDRRKRVGTEPNPLCQEVGSRRLAAAFPRYKPNRL